MLTIVAVAVLILVAALALLLTVASRRPDTFHVERSIEIAAPPDKVLPWITDLRRWATWSPWEAKDPAMTREFGPVSSGPGATYGWSGNRAVGQGTMAITGVTPSGMTLDLHFLKPFKADNTATFKLLPSGPGTRLTWGMDGRSALPMKAMGMVTNMDAMIGRDFEAGLRNLKRVAEA